MKWVLVLCGAWWLVACAGVSPRPEEMAANLPPERTLTPAEAASVAGYTTEALTRLAAGEFDEARREAESALSVDPRAARARAVRARCQMEEARRESPPTLPVWRHAEGELLTAQRLAPFDVEVGLLFAEFLEADGHLTAAAERLDLLVAAQPDEPRCLREAARVHYELGEERAAIPQLERLLTLDPQDHESLYRLAQCRHRLAPTEARELTDLNAKLALYTAASEAFGRYREAVPGDVDGFMGEAFVRVEAWRLKSGDADELAVARGLFERASELSPDSPEPFFNLGVVGELGQDGEGARSAYEAALRVDPNHLPSLLNLAANLQAAERPGDAVSYCRRALELPVTSEERGRLQAFLAEFDS